MSTQARSDTPQVLPFRFRVFELTGSLSGGGSASAYIREWNGSTWANTTKTFTAYDALGIFSGTSGKKGIAAYEPKSRRWIIWQLEC